MSTVSIILEVTIKGMATIFIVMAAVIVLTKIVTALFRTKKT